MKKTRKYLDLIFPDYAIRCQTNYLGINERHFTLLYGKRNIDFEIEFLDSELFIKILFFSYQRSKTPIFLRRLAESNLSMPPKFTRK